MHLYYTIKYLYICCTPYLIIAATKSLRILSLYIYKTTKNDHTLCLIGIITHTILQWYDAYIIHNCMHDITPIQLLLKTLVANHSHVYFKTGATLIQIRIHMFNFYSP